MCPPSERLPLWCHCHDARVEEAVPHLVGGPSMLLILVGSVPHALLCQVHQVEVAEHLRVCDTLDFGGKASVCG